MGGMRFGCATAAVVSLLIFAGDVAAQGVVQLPSYHSTSVQTTVSVPDRGTVNLGGVNRSSAGGVNQGIPGLNARPFNNGAIGGTSAGGGMWIGAQIHDFEAMDAALLSQTADNAREPLVLARRSSDSSSAGKGTSSGGGRSTSSGGGKHVSSGGGQSVTVLRANAEAEDAAKQQQAIAYLERGKQCLADGRLAVAKLYFHLAARHGTGEIKQQAVDAARSIKPPKPAANDTATGTATGAGK